MVDNGKIVQKEADAEKSVIIRASGIHRSFASSDQTRIDILRDLDLAAGEGDRLAVVGASGIGKSTLLHILGTIDRPDAGTVHIRGENPFALESGALARFRNEHIGFVFQFHHLMAEFSALENIMMPLLISGESRRRAREKAAHFLDRVGLSHRGDHRVTALSGGEQQRVALARAIVHRPGLLLADEPTGNLDRKNSEIIHELLLELSAETGGTVIVVTHSPDLAALMDRRLTLRDGCLSET